MSFIKFFFLSILLILNQTVNAYYDFDKKLEKAYSRLISFQFSDAEKLLNQEKIEKPGNDLALLYENYIFFLKAFVSEESSDYEKLIEKSSIFINEIKDDKNNETSPFHLYVQSEIFLQQAMVKIKFGDNVSAANDMRKSYKLINKNESLFPEFVLNKKISGLLSVLIGSVPGKYQWLLNTVGIEGNITDGVKQLQFLYDEAESHGFISYRPEILFYEGFISSVFGMQSDETVLNERMKALAVNTPLITYAYTNILMKQGKNDDAINILNAALKNDFSYPFTFLYFKRGLARLRKMDLKSESDFNYYLQHYKGVNNIKSTYQKLAWIAILNNDIVKYQYFLRLCREKGNKLIDDDKSAFQEAEAGKILNIYLLKSRLYFDGGYYNEAMETITNRSINDFSKYDEQLEVTYRIGRILQKKGETDKAILYFEKTIKNGLSSSNYFAANSALILGEIYEEKGNFDKARSFFNQAISIKHEQYKNSIDQKAKAGLERIKMKEINKK
jgi:tetratricopeptide (TPR) repeat protein